MQNYRPNVGIVVFNKNKEILLCARKGSGGSVGSWQFPQGGIETNEEVVQAGLRELEEETSIKSVRFVAQIRNVLRYKFPKDVILKNKENNHENYIGQEQHWILVYFFGNDTEINLKTKDAEFSRYKWTNFSEAVEKVWIMKKRVYKKVKESFEPLVEEFRSL